MPANESSLRACFMGRFSSKVVYQKFVAFTNIRNEYSLKISYSQLCIDYESKKYILKDFFIFFKKVGKVNHTSSH